VRLISTVKLYTAITSNNLEQFGGRVTPIIHEEAK
jgi:hypothetical protein